MLRNLKPQMTNILSKINYMVWDLEGLSQIKLTLKGKQGQMYLASPYTHESEEVLEQRFRAVTQAAGYLCAQGHIIFAPITAYHPIAVQYGLPRDWEYWKKIDTHYIKTHTHLGVLMLPGWQESNGIQHELKLAEKYNKIIYLIKPQGGCHNE